MESVAPRAASRTPVLTKGFRTELDLLGRHVRMLQFVEHHGPIGIIRLSTLLGVPKHKVRYSLRILEKEGYIAPSTQGARVTEKATTFLENLNATLRDVVAEIESLSTALERPAT